MATKIAKGLINCTAVVVDSPDMMIYCCTIIPRTKQSRTEASYNISLVQYNGMI